MIEWSYAINQWKPSFDDFTRRRDHERALRVISISGFTGVELTTGTGRWEPLGNPEQLAANFGSVRGFADFVRDAALDRVSSWFYDPLLGFREDLSAPADPADPDAHASVRAHATWFASALADLGGQVLVVRPTASAWQRPQLDDGAIGTIAKCWNDVGRAIAPLGVRLALHFDFLSALRPDDGLERLIAATDTETVGFSVDTGEFVAAGLDPVAFIDRHPHRVAHVQLKNAAAVDDRDEYTRRNAEHHVRKGGGARPVPRWFLELGVAPGLVDAEAVVRALVAHEYDGWVTVESDLSPHPPTSAMLNGWYLQHVLQSIVEEAR
ncbi:sugar phosphate isomerase/epimerase family protein [Naasia aerilata]|uniref:Xylose isomerase n=1 Tax=Naasia aerilata TaxID=1162966 RepID=A0ABN6XRU9_9MICO|nr:sugar phosphate isomerase/epimerase [Naasia aerilata]BDZ44115.1 xylose isomerase [Naasia aerilata]BDZ47726.1 xylose isomerase [Naasia aerilata]